MSARTLRWRSLAWDGLEHLDVFEDAGGVTARGVAVGERGDQPYGVRYQVELAPDWTFRRLEVERTDGATLRLRRDDQGAWQRDGQEAPELAGCIDIDLSGSPFTNTLPMRRHAFVGDAPARFRMAWIPLDTLEPFVDEQVYARLGPTRFRYQSADGSFERVIETDAERFVTVYPGLFERA